MIRTATLLLIGLLLCATSYAQRGDLLQRSYKPSRTTATVAFYLKEIQQQTGIEISYSDAYLKGRRRVTLAAPTLSLREAFVLLLESTGLSPLDQDGRLMLVPGAAATESAAASTLSGFIRDSSSREVVIGAYVYVPALQRGTTTNAYGFYSLELPPGRHTVVTAAGGYTSDTLAMQLSADLRRDVLLSYGLKLKEVTVSSRQEQRSDLVRLSRSELSQHAGLLGENDVLRGLQYTAGVQASSDGNSNLVVRGGDPGQNLYLLDGVPLYYIDHISGLTSVYNSDAVKSVDFYKGGFPSRYGGRLSSIVDVSSKDGDMKHFGGQASIGLLKGNLSLEGPIVKDQASMSLTARRTWIDALWRPWLDEDYLGFNFYDVNLKANWIVDSKNRIYISAYTGRDLVKTNLVLLGMEARWGNSVGSLRWTSALRPNLFLNTSVTYSRFQYSLQTHFLENNGDSVKRINYTGRNGVRDISMRTQADYYKSAQQHFQFGLYLSRSEFRPVDRRIDDAAFGNTPVTTMPFFVNEVNLYGEHIWKPTTSLDIRTGLHTSTWLQSGNKSYFSLQPRVSADWRLSKASAIFGSAARMTQFLHQLNVDLEWVPADLWVPSTRLLTPEHAWTFAAGYRVKPAASTQLKAEVYYKRLDQILTYKVGSNIFESPVPWDQQLIQGEGTSYGIEAELHQQLGPLRLDAAYMLSKSTRRFDELNGGNPFPFRYDRRHCLKSSLYYQRRKRFNAIAEYTYMSGEAITVPDQLYPDFDKNITGQFGTNPLTYNNTIRNNYRLPAIHRLDLAVNFVKIRGRRFERTWTLGVYNFLSHRNIVYAKIGPAGSGFGLNGIYYFSFIPTISYAVRF